MPMRLIFSNGASGPALRCGLAALVAALASAAPSAWAAERPEQPNVLLIMSDDLNCELGCYGHPRVESPHIDRLAERGVRFERAYCQYALCRPSRESMMTGLYPTQTGTHGNGHDFRSDVPNAVTLGQLFQRNGYESVRVGKIFHYGVPKEIGTSGDDDPASWDRVYNPKGLDKTIERKIFSLRPPRPDGEPILGGTLSWHATPDHDDRPHTDEVGARRAVELLRQFAVEDRPFFLAVGFFRPHTPFVAPQEYFDLYEPRKLNLAGFSAKDLQDLPEGARRSVTRKRAQRHLPGPLQRQIKQAYYASISFMDEQVGRLTAALHRLDLEQDTLVVFVSDHGYHMGEHGWWQKTTLFEESARVPLIVRAPWVEGAAGESTEAITELVDLYPTIADLAGLEAPGYLPGKSLRPVLKDPSANVRRAALTQLWRDNFSVRTQRYRYSEWAEGGPELYDHRSDPAEKNNLAAGEGHEEKIRQLKGLLHERLQAARRVPAEAR